MDPQAPKGMKPTRPSLRTALRSLRDEIHAALESNSTLPSATRAQPGRITVALHVVLEEQPTAEGTPRLSWVVAEPDPGKPPGHMVTVEFGPDATQPLPRAGRPSLAEQLQPVTSPQPLPLEGSEAERIANELALLFGPPGFDSSARATVFREALEGLAEEDIATTLNALANHSPAASEGPAKRARHLVTGVIKSGPLGSFERGVTILDGILRQHRVSALLQLIEQRWKTQQDWVQ